jgi:hypothetical protein
MMHSLLPGFPHVESPFFSRIFDDPAIDEATRQIAASLARDGYAAIEFPDPDIVQRADAIRARWASRFELDAWRRHGHANGDSPRVRDAWRNDPDVRAIAANPSVMALLQRLYGRRPMPFQTLNFPVGTQQHVHSDTVHFHSHPARFMCGVWVALEDIDAENGPLMYYPGSHRWPILDNEHIGAPVDAADQPPSQAMFEPAWRALIEAHGTPARTFHARKGQAFIWAANLLHGGAPQRDPARTRWSQVTHYFFENCAYYVPMMSAPMRGKIAFRNLVDIATGEPLGQHQTGGPIAPEFVAAAEPEMMRLLRTFDSARYLAANPDVAAAGVDAFDHYVRHGRREGRKLAP